MIEMMQRIVDNKKKARKILNDYYGKPEKKYGNEVWLEGKITYRAEIGRLRFRLEEEEVLLWFGDNEFWTNFDRLIDKIEQHGAEINAGV